MAADGHIAPALDAPALFRRAFTAPERTHDFVPLRTDGKWPADLRGTLVRNGPGLFDTFGRNYGHWFDGDGMLAALRLTGDGALGAVTLLETRGLLEERARGAAYFGSYGTRAPGRFFNPVRALRTVRGEGKNPSNTAVLAWNDRLFALCEAGKPLEVDPATLRATVETDLNGAIPGAFSAHPHRRASDGAMVNVGLRIGRPTFLDLVLLRPDGTAGRLASVELPFATMIHDFALTERHAVVMLAPLSIDLPPLLFGRKSFVDAHRWLPNVPTELLVFSLDAPAAPRRVSVDPFWAWHVANAFDDGEDVVIDLVRHEDYPRTQRWLSTMIEDGPGGEASGQLARLTIHPKRQRADVTLLRHRTGEFPRVDPRIDGNRHRFVHLLEHASPESGRRQPPEVIVRLDVETGLARSFAMARHELPSEAVFVPRPGSHAEGDGYLLTLVYDATVHRSHFALFDAEHVEDGPVARAFLPAHVPPGFHGVFVPA